MPTTPPTPDLEEQAASGLPDPVEPPIPGSTAATADHPRRRTIGLVAYPATILALIVAAVMLVSYGANDLSGQQTATLTPRTSPPPPPPPASAQEVDAARFDPALVKITSTGIGTDGVRLEGDLTDTALANPVTAGQHLSTILNQACVTNLHLVTADNMLVDFWGFCFASVPPEIITQAVTYGAEQNVFSLSFHRFPGQDDYRRVSFVWQTDDQDEFDRIVDSWEEFDLPPSLGAWNFTVYGTGEIADRMKYADLTEEGLEIKQPD